MKKIIYYILFLLSIPMLYSACTEEKIRITPSMKTQIDTTFKNQLNALRAETDSLCDLKFDKMVNAMKDSIIQERLEERKRKLGY